MSVITVYIMTDVFNEKIKTKAEGQCPFCRKKVKAIILEENTIRRDKCKCPDCGKVIYVCRAFGCKNFAEGGDVYDDELCPDCAKGIMNATGDVIKKGFMVGMGILATFAVKEATKKDDK